jgi:hypothetical protein
MAIKKGRAGGLNHGIVRSKKQCKYNRKTKIYIKKSTHQPPDPRDVSVSGRLSIRSGTSRCDRVASGRGAGVAAKTAPKYTKPRTKFPLIMLLSTTIVFFRSTKKKKKSCQEGVLIEKKGGWAQCVSVVICLGFSVGGVLKFLFF